MATNGPTWTTPGICVDRNSIPALTYDSGLKYKVCTNPWVDCNYIGGVYQATQCYCPPFDVNHRAYCPYGGGEAEIIATVKSYQVNWPIEYSMLENPSAHKYLYDIDNYMRTG